MLSSNKENWTFSRNCIREVWNSVKKKVWKLLIRDTCTSYNGFTIVTVHGIQMFVRAQQEMDIWNLSSGHLSMDAAGISGSPTKHPQDASCLSQHGRDSLIVLLSSTQMFVNTHPSKNGSTPTTFLAHVYSNLAFAYHWMMKKVDATLWKSFYSFIFTETKVT